MELDVLKLKQLIGRDLNLKTNEFYLLCNGKKLTNVNNEMKSPIRVVLRLPGGKGGFGSMLRAIGAQIEKTTNREACRDLSGRRLRDINEERRLKNWMSQKEAKEKEAKERKKNKLERMCQEPKSEFNDTDYEKQRSSVADNISDSLEQGLRAGPSGLSSKRSCDTINSLPTKKRIKGMLLEIDIDDISSSDISDDDDNDTGTHSKQLKVNEVIDVNIQNSICNNEIVLKTV